MTDDKKPRGPKMGENKRSDRPSRDGKPMRSYGFKDQPGGGPRGDVGRPSGNARPTGARGMKDRPGTNSVRVVSPDAAQAPTGERIAKRLARAGIASRREAETIIEAGRIAVNGKTLTSPAFNVTLEDRITIDGKPIPQIERTRLWLHHKPAGVVTSNKDPEGRPTVFEKLPTELPRVLSVGRLDINTEGLLLLTNDGGLARALELPQTGWLRRYRVRAHGKIKQSKLDELKDGIAVDGVFYGAIEATIEREQGSNVWIEVSLREGKNREIKNVMGALGLDVNRLIRTSFGPFQLGDLSPGHVLEVKGRVLQEQLGANLIEASGANFEAPITNPFPNAPVPARRDNEEADALRVTVEKRGDWVRADPNAGAKKGARPAKGGFGDKKRGDAPLDRLTTKRSDAPAPRGKGARADDADRPQERSRSTNVWMAPGARPKSRNAKPDGKSDKGSSGRPGGKPGFKKS